MPPVAPIALVAPWWRHRARGAARYTPFAGLPAAEQAWRGARAVICRTHPSGELWPRSADCGVVILIIYDVRMILSLAFRLIADDKCSPIGDVPPEYLAKVLMRQPGRRSGGRGLTRTW